MSPVRPLKNVYSRKHIQQNTAKQCHPPEGEGEGDSERDRHTLVEGKEIRERERWTDKTAKRSTKGCFLLDG